jgi:hypothetical protein
MFDGSAAGTAADSTGSTGDGDTTSAAEIQPEARARGRELNVDDDLMEDYQKAFFGGHQATKNGADSGSAGGTTDDNGNEETAEDDEAAFKKLINGKYKDAYHKYTETVIQDRLSRANRDRAELETKAAKADGLISLLAEKYGSDDPDALAKAIRGDDEMWRQTALDKGMTSEEYLKEYDQKLAAQAQQQELENLRQYKAVNELDARLQALAAETVKQYPDFNLKAEMENPKFRAALDFAAQQNEQHFKQTGKTGEVFDLTFAYEMAHADELRNNQIQRVSKATASAVAQTIQANRSRVPENAGKTVTGSTPKSYRDYTDEEFAAKLEKVRRGEAKI